MKTYEQFVYEMYTVKEKLDENVGLALRTAGRAIPGLQTAYGLGLGAYRLSQGDKTGAALAAASAIPGPVGYAALAADVAREAGVGQGTAFGKTQPTSPRPTAPTQKPTSTVPPPQNSSTQRPQALNQDLLLPLKTI